MRDAVAKQIEPRIMATASIKGFTKVVPTAKAIMMGTIEIITPIIADAIMSPKRIVHTATGLETNLSSVRACVSQGKVIGAIAEHVKKTDMDISPGISITAVISRPKAKDMNIKAGYSTPISTTGPFE
jgi:molybdopterin-binding protein